MTGSSSHQGPRDGRLLDAADLRPVSPRLIPARYIAGIPGYVIALLAVVAGSVLAIWQGWWWLWFPVALFAILAGQGLVLTPRRVRALGYLDRADDLVYAEGIMFRTVATVPFGRVQSVKIDVGPVARSFGLADVTITTAAAGNVTVPGLPKEEAERLRELLTRRGIETMAAL